MQLVGASVSMPGRLLGFARHPVHHQPAQRVVLAQELIAEAKGENMPRPSPPPSSYAKQS